MLACVLIRVFGSIFFPPPLAHHDVLVLDEVPNKVVLGRRCLVEDHWDQLAHLNAAAHVLAMTERIQHVCQLAASDRLCSRRIFLV